MNRVLAVGSAPSCCTGTQPPAPRGQRRVVSAWVAVACHLWLALGFLWAQPGARGVEGEHHDRSFGTPASLRDTHSLGGASNTHFLINFRAHLSLRLREVRQLARIPTNVERNSSLPHLVPSEEPSPVAHVYPVGRTRSGGPLEVSGVAPTSAAPV